MRFPGFLQFTPEERRAVLAILLFTGGGGLLLEIGRRHPQWVPGLLAARRAMIAPVAEGAHGRAAPESASAGPGIVSAAPETAGAAAPPHAAASLFSDPGREAPAGEPDPAPPVSARKTPPPPTPGGTVVDLNHAGPVELGTLPGIGPKLAQRIIEDRAARGPFRSLEDLARVKGIGKATVARLRGLAVTGGR